MHESYRFSPYDRNVVTGTLLALITLTIAVLFLV